jgi:hypothetical protein
VNILVDTCIWSLALRRSIVQDVPEIKELSELIYEQRVLFLGIVRQEILSGIRDETQFISLRDHLWVFRLKPTTVPAGCRPAIRFDGDRHSGRKPTAVPV